MLFCVIICFRDLYELLDSPVLQNEDPDCAFFAWEKMGDEFFNVQSVFDMPEQRITYAEKFHKANDTTDESKVKGTIKVFIHYSL